MTASPSAPELAESVAPPGAIAGDRLGRLLTLLLAALSTAAPLATDMYLPAFPRIAEQLHVAPAAVQLTLTAFLGGFTVGQLICGPLSDRWGRRRFILAGAGVMALSSVICAAAPNIGVLLAARVLQGVAGSAGVVVGRAMVADVTHGRVLARTYNLMGTLTGFAPMIAPGFGALLERVGGWRSIFLAIAAIETFLLVAAVFLARETLPVQRRHRRRDAISPRPRPSGSTRAFVGWLLVVGFGFGCTFAYISSSAFVIETHLGFSVEAYAIVFAVNSIGIVSMGAVSAASVVRVGEAALIRAGLALLTLGVALIALSVWLAGPVPVLAGFFLIAASVGLILGNATALAVRAATVRPGAALAFAGAMQFAIAAIVAPLVGLSHAGSMNAVRVVLLASLGVTLIGAALADTSAPARRKASIRRQVQP